LEIDLAGESQLNGDEGIIAFVGHSLKVAGDAAVGLGERLGSKATRDLLWQVDGKNALGAFPVCPHGLCDGLRRLFFR